MVSTLGSYVNICCFRVKNKRAKSALLLLHDGYDTSFTFHYRLRRLSRHGPGVIVALVILPKRRTTHMEVAADGRLVPEHTISDFIRLGRVVKHQTLVVFSASVHHLTKLVKVGENSKERLVEILTVLTDVITKGKDVVNVGTNHRGHVHTVLGRHHKEDFPVATVHKELPDSSVTHECPVVHAVVHEHKNRMAPANGQELLLAFYEPFKRITVIVSKNKEVWNKLLIEPIAFLCP